MKMKEAINLHHPSAYLIHSNGVRECLTCHHLFVPWHLLRGYEGPGYKDRVTEVEDE